MAEQYWAERSLSSEMFNLPTQMCRRFRRNNAIMRQALARNFPSRDTQEVRPWPYTLTG